MKRFTTILLLITVFLIPSFADDISFSGGYTKVNLQQDNKSVILSGGAIVTTKDIYLEASSITLYGQDYCYVKAEGNVKASLEEQGISLSCPAIFYDRTEGRLTSDSWIEIQDINNEASLSGAWFEYDMNASLIKMQMMATITKVTDEGLMKCQADSIEFDMENKIVTLKGMANVQWNNDSYNASIIVVNLDTNAITMHGSLTGPVNG